MMKRSQQHSLLAIGIVAAFIAAVRCAPIEIADIDERLYPQALSDRIERERREHCTRQPMPSEPDMKDRGPSPECP